MIVVIVEMCADLHLLGLVGLVLVDSEVRHDVNIMTNIVIVLVSSVDVGAGVGVFACHID